MTLTDYVESILEREIALPDADEWLSRVRSREPAPEFADVAIAYIRAVRDAETEV